MARANFNSNTVESEPDSIDGRSYEALFQPIKARNLVIPNRLACAPTVHNHATEDGYVSPTLRDIYRQKAQGGWGLITVEATYIRPDGSNFRRMLGCYEDKCLAGLNEIAELIQEGGARASIQLMHGGRVANSVISGRQPVAPSADAPPWSVVPHELTDNEIEELLDHWAHMAELCKLAKFDMVTLHGAHGMLLNQFFSPFTNLRKDRWGDRELFVLELIRRVRKAVGPDFPIAMRWTADEMIGETGYGLDDTLAFAPKMVQAGVDLLDISAAIFESYDWIIQPIYMNRGCLVHMAEAVKQVVDVPVVTVARINSASLAARIVREGRADIVSVARQAVADPLFAKKVRERRVKDIRMCIYCDTCSDYEGNQLGLKCAVNYEFGRQTELRLEPAREPKRVLVVGAGVAGLEAARVAHLRGHDVTVWEARERVGGAVRHVAAAIPNTGPRELGNLPTWYTNQVRSLGITIETGKTATAADVAAFAADVVVLAVGSRPSVPEVAGIDSAIVYTIDEYLAGKPDTGERVVIVGGQHGAELAVGLRRGGKTVTLIDESDDVTNARYIYAARRKVLREMLAEAGVKVLVNARLEAVTEQGARVSPASAVKVDSGVQAGLVKGAVSLDLTTLEQEQLIAADVVILALERVANTELSVELRRLNGATLIYEIGDCVEPANIIRAVHKGAYLGREI